MIIYKQMLYDHFWWFDDISLGFGCKAKVMGTQVEPMWTKHLFLSFQPEIACLGGDVFFFFFRFLPPTPPPPKKNKQPTKNQPKKKPTDSTTLFWNIFRCKAGYWNGNWHKGWSASKKDYCCAMAGKGGGFGGALRRWFFAMKKKDPWLFRVFVGDYTHEDWHGT